MSNKAYKFLDKFLLTTVCILVLLFVFWPFLAVFIEGFKDSGVEEMLRIASNSLFLIRNSLILAVLSTLLTAVISLAIAITVFYASKNMRKIIHALLLLSLISPPFVGALSYINLFGRRGFISYHVLGLSTRPYGLYGLVLMQSFSFISLAALILSSRVLETDQSLIDSARSLGANTNRQIRDVILPHLRSSLRVVMMLTFIRSLSDFTTPAIIGGRFSVLATEAYLSYITNQGNLKQASLLNLLLFIPAFIAFFFYIRSFRQLTSSSHGISVSSIENRGKGLALNVARIISIFFTVWLVLQYGSIFVQAFAKYSKGKMSFTLDNWVETAPYIRGAFIRSITYSLIASLGCTLIGFLIAYYLYMRKIKWMKAIDWIATMPYIVPGTFFGIGYILAFRSPPLKLTGSAAIVVLNMLFKTLPFAGKLGSGAVAAIDQNLPLIVQDLGGHPLRSFRDVLLPQARKPLLLCFLNSFASGMTTIGSIIFLVYPGRKLATMVLFDVIQSGKHRVASVIAVVITLICVTLNYISFRISESREFSRGT